MIPSGYQVGQGEGIDRCGGNLQARVSPGPAEHQFRRSPTIGLPSFGCHLPRPPGAGAIQIRGKVKEADSGSWRESASSSRPNRSSGLLPGQPPDRREGQGFWAGVVVAVTVAVPAVAGISVAVGVEVVVPVPVSVGVTVTVGGSRLTDPLTTQVSSKVRLTE